MICVLPYIREQKLERSNLLQTFNLLNDHNTFVSLKKKTILSELKYMEHRTYLVSVTRFFDCRKLFLYEQILNPYDFIFITSKQTLIRFNVIFDRLMKKKHFTNRKITFD